MTLEQLQIVEAVVSEGSFRAAADKLWKTQPAISISINKLEQELGLQLFERGHRKTTLTPIGERIFQQAQHVLGSAQRLRELSKYLVGEREAVLRLAADVICPLKELLPVLRSFFTIHELTRLDLSFEVLGGGIERLEQDTADIIISNLDSNELTLDRQALWDVEMLPVCAPQYLPLDNKGFIANEKLRSFTQIVISETSQERANSQSLLEGGHRWYVSEMEIKSELLRAGMGWGSMPRHKVASDLEQGNLVPFHSENRKEIFIPFYACRRQNKLHGPVANALWEHLQKLR